MLETTPTIEAATPADHRPVARVVEEAIGQPADVTVHVEPALPEHLRATRGYRAWME